MEQCVIARIHSNNKMDSILDVSFGGYLHIVINQIEIQHASMATLVVVFQCVAGLNQ